MNEEKIKHYKYKYKDPQNCTQVQHYYMYFVKLGVICD